LTVVYLPLFILHHKLCVHVRTTTVQNDIPCWCSGHLVDRHI